MKTPLRARLMGFAYRRLAKPVFFRMDPESVHERATRLGAWLGASSFGQGLTRALLHHHDPVLEQTLCGLFFPNPIGLAAGFDKNAHMVDILPHVGFGFAELGSITGEPCEGNPRPRLWRIPHLEALRVHYGLKNDGARAVAARLRGRTFPLVTGISAAKTNCRETCDEFAAIHDYGIVLDEFRDIADYFTLNISCPNAFGGQPFTEPALLDMLLSAVDRRELCQPVFIKLSPDLGESQLDALLEVVGGHRVRGIVCTNLTKDHELMGLSADGLPGRGGISGRAVQSLSERQLEHVYRRTRNTYVLVGVGGMFTAQDVYRRIRLGASLVQLITGMVYRGPQLIGELNHGLAHFLKRDGFRSIAEAVGADVK
jgi:dihydroorotate dehydrogenase